MFRRPSIVALLALALTTGACGIASSSAGDTTDPVGTPVPTIAGVGALPDTVPPNRAPLVMVRAPLNEDGTTAELIGVAAEGNRVLLIGDSIMASTSSRYGGQMCDALVPLGWQVAVEAEPSRFVEFGNRVLDRVLDADAAPVDDWNAAVVFLGSNYGGDEVRYEAELRRILDRLAPRPTLLLTVTEYRSNYVEVNEVVRRLGAEFDNVTVVDWKTLAETPGVLSSDRLHPTESGREVLAEAIAAALGPIGIGEGECLRSVFRDDSAINRGSGGGSSVGSSSSSRSSSSRSSSSSSSSSGTRTTATTVQSSVTTSTVGGSSGSEGSGGSGTATTTTVGSGDGVTPSTTAA
ncbi:MAG: GDSL-type esterase/lipase family protein, partial [Ilumatobacteraceae bacterium]